MITQHAGPAATLVAIVGASILGYFWLYSKPRDGIETFPGPKPQLLLGNLKDMPRDDRLGVFDSWRAKWGDIVYVRIPRLHILVLSSLADAEDLFVNRGNIWSGRNQNYLVNELVGFGWNLVQLQPGEAFSETRKIFRKAIGPQSVSDFDPLIEHQAEDFLSRLKDHSGDPHPLIVDSIGAVVIKLAYGGDVYRTHGEELVKVNVEGFNLVIWCLAQIWIVNFMPISRILPSWFPGLRYPPVVKRGRELFLKVRNWGFDLVKGAQAEGHADFSVATKYLNDPSINAEHLRDTVATMFIGAVDTTSTSLLAFICSMLLYPDVQSKIQHELDEFVGCGNTPRPSVAQSLRYLDAAWRESMRLNPPFPTGVPRVSTTSDIWKGRYLPERTMIICNIAFMLRDPRLWGPDADEFKPERFLSEFNPNAAQLPDVTSIPFGFGKRICPGRYLANRVGITYAAAVLSVYSIVPLEEEPLSSIEFTKTQIRRPINVRCRFVPRQ